jgi:hypothetical protein
MSGTAVTQFLRNWRTPNPACAGQVVASLYSELHRMAAQAFRSESPGHILQPTALIFAVRPSGATALISSP